MDNAFNWAVISFMIGVLGFMWKIASDTNAKTQTVFRRFDEHKEHLDQKMKKDFVTKEVFIIELAHTTKDLQRVETKMDAGFASVDKKLDRLLNGSK